MYINNFTSSIIINTLLLHWYMACSLHESLKRNMAMMYISDSTHHLDVKFHIQIVNICISTRIGVVPLYFDVHK